MTKNVDLNQADTKMQCFLILHQKLYEEILAKLLHLFGGT